MDLQRKEQQPFGEAPLSAHGIRAEEALGVNYSSMSAARTAQPFSAPRQSKSPSVTASKPEKDTQTNLDKPSPPNNRHQRRTSKRTQLEPPVRPESLSNENEQATAPKSNTDGRKASSRQSGRKRNQRTRTDSLPQKAPRT
jgi:hypothetical protein